MSERKPRVSVTVTKQCQEVLDDLVETGVYLTQGEAVRAALLLLMKEQRIPPFYSGDRD